MSGSDHPLAPRPARLGLGCVTFGREIDRTNAFAMMDHAVAHDIVFFDTAAAYGGGMSETIVGEWLRERGTRKRITLATKILPPYTPDKIQAALGLSLQRLGVSSVDMLFLHRWDETVQSPETLRALDAIVREGGAQAIAASNFSAGQLAGTLGEQSRLGLKKFSALQNIHNFAVRGIDAATIDECVRHDVRTIGYSPLGAGFLPAKHEQQVQPGSRFDLIPGHQAIYFNEQARTRLARLRAVADTSGVSIIQLALGWALRQPGVDTVLVGGRTTAHLDQALAARAPGLEEIVRILEVD